VLPNPYTAESSRVILLSALDRDEPFVFSEYRMLLAVMTGTVWILIVVTSPVAAGVEPRKANCTFAASRPK